MAATIQKYAHDWPADATPLEIEMACIRSNIGNPSIHYEGMRRLCWPNLDDHRWHRLCRDEILANKITVLMGCGSSGKTHTAAWIYLCEWMVFPNETCVLVSSTDIRGLRGRVWGEITTLWQQAKDRFPWLPGHLVDSRLMLLTDDLGDPEEAEKRARDVRRGIIAIPCVQNGRFIGLGKYSGWKQRRMRLVADEAQFMGSSFLSAFANLDKNIDFRAIILGNPNDVLDPLGKAAEPIDGWGEHLQPEKTEVWKTRFMGGTCVNLIGTDSPNFDFPADKPAKYPYLISREKIANTLSFFPKDSVEYFSQCIGAMKIGLMERRVISRDMCRKFRALEDVVWEGTATTKIAGLDASYGGDRCVCGHVEFGKEVGGGIVLNIHPPVIVPIKADEMPEEQITEFVKAYCEGFGIPPQNFFHDSTGRGSLGTSLARGWSNQCNPVEFGGMATKRPVCLDLFILDPQTGRQRLKLCLEHYLYFVTELWFSVRYAIEAKQVRNMPEDVMEEMCMRKWEKVGDKIRIEPKTGTPDKPGMKQRTGRSPDLGDWLAIAVEGARRRGFQISKLANKDAEAKSYEWLREMRDKAVKFRRKSDLVEV